MGAWVVQGWQWGNVGGTENLQEVVVRLEESFNETVQWPVQEVNLKNPKSLSGLSVNLKDPAGS